MIVRYRSIVKIELTIYDRIHKISQYKLTSAQQFEGVRIRPSMHKRGVLLIKCKSPALLEMGFILIC
jgi:hypothetical protein